VRFCVTSSASFAATECTSQFRWFFTFPPHDRGMSSSGIIKMSSAGPWRQRLPLRIARIQGDQLSISQHQIGRLGAQQTPGQG